MEMKSNYNNKGHLPRIAVGTTILALLLLAGGAGAATEINSCTTISGPGEYVLTADLASSVTCINITSSNVVFDGAGHTISGGGDSWTYGIYVSNSTILTDVNVKNVKVTDWKTGIYYNNIQGGNISNNTAASNWNAGIDLISSNNCTLVDNTLLNSNNYGEF
jgi:parallel beta-helix repeat protein